MVLDKLRNWLVDRIVYPCASRFRRLYEKFYFKRLRSRLKNKDFSLFSPNCYAGIIYHRLGMEFTSPTINMLFPVKKQYLKFVSNIAYYLQKDLVFVKDSDYNCPVAMLEDIKLVFNHYSSAQQANEAWEKRKRRVNYDNIFLIFDDISDVEYEDLRKFNQIDCKGKSDSVCEKIPGIFQRCSNIKVRQNKGDEGIPVGY